MSWDLFISYAAEDRDGFALPLATALQERGHRVWFDVFELRPGDRLRASIDRGLAGVKLGVVVVSKSYLSKHWTQVELGDLFATRASLGCRIVPIWLHVDSTYVASHSPTLADIKAIHAASGMARVVEEIEILIRNPEHGLAPRPSGSSDLIRVDAGGMVTGVDDTFVRYNRLILSQGKNPDLRIDIDLYALRNEILISDRVYEAAHGTCDFHRVFERLAENRAHGPKERSLYTDMHQIAPEIEKLEGEFRHGIVEVLTRSAIRDWVASERDAVLTISGYIGRYFTKSTEAVHLELLMLDRQPGWKLHMWLPYSDASTLYRRAQRARAGGWLEWTHDMLVSRLVPAILYRAVHQREWTDPESVPDSVFDLKAWSWFVSDADPEWGRATSPCT
jgi:hypothetical protein